MQRLKLGLVALLLASCGSNSDPNEGGGNQRNNLIGEIEGETWIADCDSGTRSRVVLGNGLAGLYADGYSNADCSGSPSITSASVATMTLGQMSVIVAGAQEVDFTAQSLAFIPRNQAMVDYLKATCPDFVWTLNVATEISGKKCLSDDPWPAMPSPTKYAILKKDTSANTLQLWKSLIVCVPNQPCYGGDTPANRVRELDSRIFRPRSVSKDISYLL